MPAGGADKTHPDKGRPDKGRSEVGRSDARRSEVGRSEKARAVKSAVRSVALSEDEERQRRRELRDANTRVIELPQTTDLQTWNVFNGITAAARDEVRFQRRTALEMLGSDVLQAFLPPASKN